MIGRSCCCLLVFAVVSTAPLLSGQVGVQQPSRTARVVVSRPVTEPPPSSHERSMRAPFLPGLHERSESAFSKMARAAGMIFSATVTRIERRPAGSGEAVETVRVTFHVERAVRGVTPGEDLVISQWIGLWAGGQRYRMGERLVLFLYPRSRLGLSSCVGGRLGRFEVDARGRVLLSGEQASGFRRDAVLGGRSQVAFSDLALAVRHAREEE
jgi:hypothetical protein